MIGSRDTAISPVSDRLLVLQFVRVLILVALLAVPVLAGTTTPAVVAIALVYLVFVSVVELLRRVAPEQGSVVVSWTVLIDGAVIALAVAVTGGYRSPLLFLVFLDVMAVTLVASYRTGLKLALWCALLLLLAHAAADAGVIDEAGFVDDRIAIVSAATFLLFAAVHRVVLRGQRAFAPQQPGPARATGGAQRRARARHPPGRRHGDAGAPRVQSAGLRPGRRAHAHRRHLGGRRATTASSRPECTFPTTTPRSSWSPGRPAPPILVRLVDDDLLDLVLPGARNVVVAPVAVDGQDLGVAVAEWGGGSEARIPTSTVQALAQAATHTALALRNAQLMAEIERLATRDSLTGLANRRLFDESLHRELARSQRLGSPLSLLVLDVDHFKQVNDTYGHQTGDAILRQVANAIVANTKNFDVTARYGGDEFVVLLPGCGRDDAMGVAERVRSGIAQQVGEAPVTISAGVATTPDNANDAERLMAAADAALYEAKRTGRDRVAASTRGQRGRGSPLAQLVGAARPRRLTVPPGGPATPMSGGPVPRPGARRPVPAAPGGAPCPRRNAATSRRTGSGGAT